MGEVDAGDCRLIWIGLRPGRRAVVDERHSAVAEVGSGLVGDHATQGRHSHRQLTLITTTDLEALERNLGRKVEPTELRRNLLLEGLLPSWKKGLQYRLGDVLLEVTGPCEPCGRMREVLGQNGYLAMRGHGGVTARILRGGLVQLGQSLLPAQMDLFG